MKFKELSQLSAEERENKQKELELELIKLNTQVATGTPPKNAGMVRRIKKDIARIMLLKGNAQNKAKAQESISKNKSVKPAKSAGDKKDKNSMGSAQKINKSKERKQ
jgi:ribosomal protein L29